MLRLFPPPARPRQRRQLAAVGAMVAFVLAASGCRQFLTGSKYRNDPNNPSSATVVALFTSIQVNVTTRLEDHLARTVCIWMQQCSGQVQPYISVGEYATGQDDYYFDWAGMYGGGGLIDLHTVEAQSAAIGDSIFVGQAAILEALLIGTAADIWGDIPYSQAANPKFPTPMVDPQQSVYDSLQVKLANAIVLLGATGPTNGGAGGTDLVYGGDPTLWQALASTLRARYYLHVAKRHGPVAYDSAFAVAQSGIAPGGDYVSINNNTALLTNLWSQFNTIYTGNIAAGAFMVNLLTSQVDSVRLAAYYGTNSAGNYVGADPGVVGGDLSSIAAARLGPAFLQPFVTYAENQLIIAEAALEKTSPNPAAALTALNNERVAAGVPPLAGPATLSMVMTEKYIADFQNLEGWNDWKRHVAAGTPAGIPALVPFAGGAIPRRLVYPLSERAANPNIPADPQQNWNDGP
jgi:starch-binding outer membrane protein, SusD/RagB family